MVLVKPALVRLGHYVDVVSFNVGQKEIYLANMSLVNDDEVNCGTVVCHIQLILCSVWGIV